MRKCEMRRVCSIAQLDRMNPPRAEGQPTVLTLQPRFPVIFSNIVSPGSHSAYDSLEQPLGLCVQQHGASTLMLPADSEVLVLVESLVL